MRNSARQRNGDQKFRGALLAARSRDEPGQLTLNNLKSEKAEKRNPRRTNVDPEILRDLGEGTTAIDLQGELRLGRGQS